MLYDRAMLHRVAGTAALVGALLLAGCKSKSQSSAADKVGSTEVVAPRASGDGGVSAQDAAPGGVSEVHGNKWADPEDPKTVGGFSMFKEAWVYVDGKPVGVLREAELPPIPAVWIDQVEALDFKPGDPPPHERIYQVRRWRLSDYIKAVGVELRDVKAVLVHGGRGTVLVPGDIFRKLHEDVLFDLTGNNNLKLRVFFPDAMLPHILTSFDRYAAISIIVDKPVPTANEENDLVLDGVILEGIPFYGQPLRGGIRVYLDGKLAVIIKRNALGDEGRVAPGVDEWSVTGLLTARGIDPSKIAAADILDAEQKASRLDAAAVPKLTFKTSEQAQGAVLLSTGGATNAILLWSEGKVPPIRQLSPSERDKPAK